MKAEALGSTRQGKGIFQGKYYIGERVRKGNGCAKVFDHLLEVFGSKLHMKFYHLHAIICFTSVFYFSM